MLLKYVKNVNMEDDYIKVDKDDPLLDVMKKLIDIRENKSNSIDANDFIYIPILAAYVIEKGKPIGVIYEEDMISEVILKNKNPKKLVAKDVMKPPICLSINQEVKDAINTIIDKGLLTVAVCDGEELVGVISVFDAILLAESLDKI